MNNVIYKEYLHQDETQDGLIMCQTLLKRQRTKAGGNTMMDNTKGAKKCGKPTRVPGEDKREVKSQ